MRIFFNKFFVFFPVVFILGSLSLFAQKSPLTLVSPANNTQKKTWIEEGERRFLEKNYTECLHIYEHLYHKEKYFSPKMLFEMGFIYEGLGDYTNALYFLNLYYQYEPDWQLLQHIESIAQRYRLKGYNNDDQDFVFTLYYQYFDLVWGTLIVVCGLLCVYIFWYEWQGNHVPTPRKILLLFCVCVFFVSNFWLKNPPSVIIMKDQSYLMSAPSASSDVIKVINKGHKLYIGRSQDIWQEVYWENQKVYIRNTNVAKVD